MAHRLKRDFPQLTIVLNGGLTTEAQMAEHLVHVDGVMIGRHAYHEPWAMASWDAQFLGAPERHSTREMVEDRMLAYLESLASSGVPWGHASRHMLGLRNGQPGARRWRQVWSDPRHKPGPPAAAQRLAREAQRAAETPHLYSDTAI